ncbi:hypothetical protein XENOCAPTIV_006010 [Xenoophorus captivus]|uniref:Uncharacterized protein n=1 Tax=Xenoophorus captivus TaxID=1517983 RepID=A0ABV0S1J7_9TELE
MPVLSTCTTEWAVSQGFTVMVFVQFLVAVGFLLVVVLAFTYPKSSPQLGLVNLGCCNWSSPLSHVRLLSLPIAKKYNLQGSMSILLEEEDGLHSDNLGLPQGPANFTLLWVLGWLVVGEGLPTVRVVPVERCQKHCSSFNLWLSPGDMGNSCCSCTFKLL